MKKLIRHSVLLSSLLVAGLMSHAATTITVQTDQPGAKINPGMWGIFFEDINLGADGGLYAELVKNRSFEFPNALMGWTMLGATNGFEIRDEKPFSRVQPHYLRLKSDAGMANQGFRGIGIRAGETYHFSVAARVVEGSPVLKIELIGSDGRLLASSQLDNFSSSDWKQQSSRLVAASEDAKAQLKVSVENGTIDLDMVSLFPDKTWKHRPGGLRADMVQMLADLKPGFMRFPGGCIVEGHTLPNRYQWKTTIGPVAERRLIMNRWNDEFKNRATPDYYQSFGLGFFEFFQLCEDIGASPLPILNCGMACQYNSGQLVPLDQLDPYIQDALDLIEFANGSVTSEWGAKRAAMGHPQPFNLKMLGVGNEQWGSQYVERYTKFAAALQLKHPEIKLVAASGPDPGGKNFDFLWSKWRELKPDFVDEHFYRPPDWFFSNTHRYDQYDRNGPKVFAGEYAARANNLQAALAEAAMMTGFERNGDVVRMASYAPLFAHIEGWQWKPDLIWVDNLRTYGTPNYYVQKMFANNSGDEQLPVRLEAGDATKLFVSAVRDHVSSEAILKVVNGGNGPVTANLNFAGARGIASEVKICTLASGSQQDENSFAAPLKVSPQNSQLKTPAPQFDYPFPANSLTVLRFKITN